MMTTTAQSSRQTCLETRVALQCSQAVVVGAVGGAAVRIVLDSLTRSVACTNSEKGDRIMNETLGSDGERAKSGS